MPSFVKDPDEELDYSVDWSAWVPKGDTIAKFEWEVPVGLTEPHDATRDGEKVTVWLAGGEIGKTYPILSRVETQDGRKGERTLHVKVAQK